MIACSSSDYDIKIWHSTNWSLKLNYTEHTRYLINSVNGLEYVNDDNDDGKMVSSGTNGLLFWSLNNGKLIKNIQINTKIYSLRLLSNGIDPRVITGGGLGRIQLWNLRLV